MDISVGYWDVETALCGDDIQKFIEEKFNVTFEPMNVTWDDYYEKEQTWAATDSLPDVFCADFRASATFGKWAREGVIRSIPEDLSAYPNLSAYLDSPAAEGCKIDGDLYCIFSKSFFYIIFIINANTRSKICGTIMLLDKKALIIKEIFI